MNHDHHSFHHTLEHMQAERAERKRIHGGYLPTVPEWYEMPLRDRIWMIRNLLNTFADAIALWARA